MSPLQAVEATGTGTQVARPLKVLVPLIKDDLAKGKEAAEQAGMPYYRAAGEKMLEAKSQVSGGFEEWVRRNFGISASHARTYMALARTTVEGKNGAAAPFENLEDFRRRHLGHNRPSEGRVHREWRADVDDIAERARRDMDRFREESLTRQQEREAEQKLAIRLIDIGYKVMAKELHPDKGGSRDAMQRLTRVRDRLKSHA
jgi:hypothetical protein